MAHNQQRLGGILLVALLVLVVSGCGGVSRTIRVNDGTSDSGTWTILVYMAADNDLDKYALQNINEMETVGSTSRVSIVVQIDRSPNSDGPNGSWATTRRYYVTRDSNTSLIGSTLLEDMGELNMAAPETLEDFVEWGVRNYPADRYLLVLWDHGRGWETRTLAMVTRETRAVFIDNTSGDEMSLHELSQALSATPHLDIVLFDACLMGMVEVAYSIKDAADIMVASEENIPVAGQPYQRILATLNLNPEMTPRALSTTIVNQYIQYYASASGTFTMSAIELSSLNDLVSATEMLAGAVTANLEDASPGVRLAQQRAQHYDFDKLYYTDYKDLYDFARLCETLVANEAVRSAAAAVMSAVDDVVIAERNSGDEVACSHGISIYIPAPDALSPRYPALQFAVDTQWDEMLAAY